MAMGTLSEVGREGGALYRTTLARLGWNKDMVGRVLEVREVPSGCLRLVPDVKEELATGGPIFGRLDT
jgi:hypothetical protein